MHTERLDCSIPPPLAWEQKRQLIDDDPADPTPAAPLPSVRLFSGLGLDALAAVARVAKRYELSSNRYFFEHGPSDTLYLLQSGCVSITQAGRRGAREQVRLVAPWEFFGAMGDLRDQLRPASAQALCRSRALGWKRDVLCRLMRAYPTLALNALSELEDQLYRFQCEYEHRSHSPHGGPLVDQWRK